MGDQFNVVKKAGKPAFIRFHNVIDRVHYYDEINHILRVKEKEKWKFYFIPLSTIQKIEKVG
jgi:hypothetical protein